MRVVAVLATAPAWFGAVIALMVIASGDGWKDIEADPWLCQADLLAVGLVMLPEPSGDRRLAVLLRVACYALAPLLVGAVIRLDPDWPYWLNSPRLIWVAPMWILGVPCALASARLLVEAVVAARTRGTRS